MKLIHQIDYKKFYLFLICFLSISCVSKEPARQLSSESIFEKSENKYKCEIKKINSQILIHKLNDKFVAVVGWIHPGPHENAILSDGLEKIFEVKSQTSVHNCEVLRKHLEKISTTIRY